jgi:glycyl-tRNA synthetase beta chain
MVGEFPELQGVMGRVYHLAEDGELETARAIEEHYAPRAAAEPLPETNTGALLSMVDKIDSIVGCFRVGLAPTGSQDPYALRRQALGLLRILRERAEWTLPLGTLIAAASEQFADLGDECDADVVEFIKQRLRNQLTDEGHRPEVVDAIFVTDDDEVRSLVAKVQALSQIVDQDDFREIAGAAKRVLNILRQAEAKLGASAFSRPDGAEYTQDEERALAEALPKTRDALDACWERADHLGAFRALGTLRPQVDAFFDNVRVMDSDESARDRRLALLSDFRALFMDIADISRIAVERES